MIDSRAKRAAPLPGIQAALQAVGARRDLSTEVAEAAFAAVIAGGVAEDDIVALLSGLRDKGETADELAGVVRALRQSMRRLTHARPDTLVDTCGTGGGSVTTVNISTAAAFVVAAVGVPVAKHGNRSFTSRSGSADVLEALGVRIDLEPDAAAAVLAQEGIVFLFAPTYHPAMRHIAAARRRLGVATIMNLVGPLANPASALRQVVGVADRARGPIVAGALAALGATHALVVHGDAGLDEIAPVGMTTVWEIRDGSVREWRLDPRDYQLDTPSLEGLAGGEPAENAARIQALFDRPDHAAPALRSAVVLNAAAAIHVAGLFGTFESSASAAVGALMSGAARDRLDGLRRATARLSTSG